MAWLIGDVQGCLKEAKALIEICIESRKAPLLFLGDLVNRGPDSHEVLIWLSSLDEDSACLIGNHELGVLRGILAKDLDRNPDLHWLRHLSSANQAAIVDQMLSWDLMREEDSWLGVHGGLPPNWEPSKVADRIGQAQLALRNDPEDILLNKRGEHLEVQETLHLITRIRFVDAKGNPDFSFKGKPEHAPKGLSPWFHLRPGNPAKTVCFGHWAALGVYGEPGYQALDGGCVWGRTLAAYCTETRTIKTVSAYPRAPGETG